MVLKELLKFLSDFSLTSGIFADALKIAGVTPVLKFDNLEENGILSVLSCFWQIIKWIISNRPYKYLVSDIIGQLTLHKKFLILT